MRLVKNGVVRETGSGAAIRRLRERGWLDAEDTRPISGELVELTVEQLRELCRQRGITPPAGARKAELAQAMTAYNQAHQREASSNE